MRDLFSAGARGLRFNAPLSDERAEDLVEHLMRAERRSIVDLGCGRGELVRLTAATLQSATVVGVDTDEVSIEAARQLAADSVGADRIRFEVADAATWSGAVDGAVCVGASHAFGGPVAMFARLAELTPSGWAVVGDGVWESAPSQWCLDVLGEQPVGLNGLTELAEAAGWTVVESDLSSRSEWDSFEGRWSDGVRSVGSDAALALANEREAEYRRHYRGVLGFAWLVLSR